MLMTSSCRPRHQDDAGGVGEYLQVMIQAEWRETKLSEIDEGCLPVEYANHDILSPQGGIR